MGRPKRKKNGFYEDFFLKGSSEKSAEHGNVTGSVSRIFGNSLLIFPMSLTPRSPIFALSHAR